jgi:hypothetical protein
MAGQWLNGCEQRTRTQLLIVIMLFMEALSEYDARLAAVLF